MEWDICGQVKCSVGQCGMDAMDKRYGGFLLTECRVYVDEGVGRSTRALGWGSKRESKQQRIEKKGVLQN